MTSLNSWQTLQQLSVDGIAYDYYSLPALESAGFKISHLPCSLKILLENLLRHEDGVTVTRSDIQSLVSAESGDREIAYRPARVLMQDFTGVPAVVDLGAMRDAIKKMGGDPQQINPLSPVDLVIDHSIQVDAYGSTQALAENSRIEMQRNRERYAFLRWGQTAFANFRVVPPEAGICHQVNLEFLAKTIWHEEKNGRHIAYPDTLVGTDSHTTMVNGLGVLGWGVGGIEAEAAMLGQPVSMLVPQVVGVEIKGTLPEGVTATDLVLTLTQQLRKRGVVGKFVEFYGEGLVHLSVSDRATLANMAPEYGATCGYFPVDQLTLEYLQLTGRDMHTIHLVEAYAKAQGMWIDSKTPAPVFPESLTLDLTQIKPSMAGPKRPQDRVLLDELSSTMKALLPHAKEIKSESNRTHVMNGDVVIAAITSCTNTSNPAVMVAAGLVAKKAVEKGLQRKPWVKTSLAPGSTVVTEYLAAAGLNTYLSQLGFDVVGYGCTTCIGNSGPLPEDVTNTIAEQDLLVSAVLSGNRNFEGRIHPLVKANWLASPPLVVIFALTGTTCIDLSSEPVGHDQQNQPVYLRDLWPDSHEIAAALATVNRGLFQKQYENVFAGSTDWQAIPVTANETYAWLSDSTYIQHPPFFDEMTQEIQPVKSISNARVLAVLGDSITTDHISPAGSIKPDSPAGIYLLEKGVSVKDFNSYGARRGNHEVMMRGTLANIRIRNEMLEGVEGGYTRHFPSGEILPIHDAAMRYQTNKTPLVIIAGKEYGTGSSRDWAAKGPKLLGVRVVIAESFERIHRSNLIGMGILPLQFKSGENRFTWKMNGSEIISVALPGDAMKPGEEVQVMIERSDGTITQFTAQSRIDTQKEIEYYRHGGILPFVLRSRLKGE